MQGLLSGAELLAKPCTNRRGTRQQGAEVTREEREQVAAAGGGGGLFLPYGLHLLGGVLRTLVAVAKDTSREGRAQEVLQLNMGRSMLRSSIGRGPGALVSTVPNRNAHPSRRHNECMHWATEPLGSTACQSMTDGQAMTDGLAVDVWKCVWQLNGAGGTQIRNVFRSKWLMKRLQCRSKPPLRTAATTVTASTAWQQPSPALPH